MFIDQHLGEFRLDIMCRVLEVTESGFQTWRRRPKAMRHLQDEEIASRIREIYQEHQGRYGAPRIQAMLRREGRQHSEKRVSRLMCAQGFRGKTKRKFVVTTDSNHSQPVADNLLARHFSPAQPNQVWVSDITFIPTKEGWLYLAITMDLFARYIAGWAMASTMTTELPLKALQMAVSGRNPPSGLMHHSDRGSQYTSGAFRAELAAHQLVCSMSRTGECWDNAVAESFFGTLKLELVDGQIYETHAEAMQAIFEYVEVYYNRKRLHSTLGYLTPHEAEQQTHVA